jgi:hypothetical protein
MIRFTETPSNRVFEAEDVLLDLGCDNCFFKHCSVTVVNNGQHITNSRFQACVVDVIGPKSVVSPQLTFTLCAFDSEHGPTHGEYLGGGAIIESSSVSYADFFPFVRKSGGVSEYAIESGGSFELNTPVKVFRRGGEPFPPGTSYALLGLEGNQLDTNELSYEGTFRVNRPDARAVRIGDEPAWLLRESVGAHAPPASDGIVTGVEYAHGMFFVSFGGALEASIVPTAERHCSISEGEVLTAFFAETEDSLRLHGTFETWGSCRRDHVTRTPDHTIVSLTSSSRRTRRVHLRRSFSQNGVGEVFTLSEDPNVKASVKTTACRAGGVEVHAIFGPGDEEAIHSGCLDFEGSHTRPLPAGSGTAALIAHGSPVLFSNNTPHIELEDQFLYSSHNNSYVLVPTFVVLFVVQLYAMTGLVRSLSRLFVSGGSTASAMRAGGSLGVGESPKKVTAPSVALMPAGGPSFRRPPKRKVVVSTGGNTRASYLV